MPAGLKNMVVASSAAAAPPANALPSPLLCSINANADAAAFPENAANALATATPINDCVNFIFISPLLSDQLHPTAINNYKLSKLFLRRHRPRLSGVADPLLWQRRLRPLVAGVGF